MSKHVVNPHLHPLNKQDLFLSTFYPYSTNSLFLHYSTHRILTGQFWDIGASKLVSQSFQEYSLVTVSYSFLRFGR